MKTKAHIQYKTKDGEELVGVTTVTRQIGWSKNILIKWANNLGLKGIDSGKYKDDKADIGTLAHEMSLEYFLKELDIDTSDYSKNQIKSALKSFASFKKWYKDNKIEPILIEEPLTNSKFGGTLDLYGELHGDKCLIDLKTGKGVYPTHKVQVSAYKKLLNNNDYEVDRVLILKIPRSDNETFQVVEVFNADKIYEKLFLPALELWKNDNLVKG